MSKKVQTFLTANRAHLVMEYKHHAKIFGAARAKLDYDDLMPQIKEDLKHTGLKYIGLTPGAYTGFPLGLLQTKDGYKITAGCRTFSPAAAKRHWRSVVKGYETKAFGELGDVALDHKGIKISPDRYERAKAMLKKLPKLHAKAVELGYVKK